MQVALFNSIAYRIPMCRDYLGHRFTKGHQFDLYTCEVSEMRTAIACPDFDPSSLSALPSRRHAAGVSVTGTVHDKKFLMSWKRNVGVDMYVAVCVNRTSLFVEINRVSPQKE